jgi:hypothetical protein
MKRLRIPALVMLLMLGWVAVAGAQPNLFNTFWVGNSRVITIGSNGVGVVPSTLTRIVFQFTRQSLNAPTPPISGTALVSGTVQILSGTAPTLPFTGQLTPVPGTTNKFTLLMAVKDTPASPATTLINAILTTSTITSQNKIQGVFQDLTDGSTGDFSVTKQ